MSQESVAINQRARIHRAMIELATERGRRGITVRGLTKLAGVSTATFYALFDGVDDCLLSASGSVVEEIRERILAARIFSGPRVSQGDQAVRALFEGLTADPKVGRLALIEAFAGGPAALGVITSQETSLEHALRSSLSRRGEPASATAVQWVAAGALHAARGHLSDPPTEPRSGASQNLLAWAGPCLVDPHAKPAGGQGELETTSSWARHDQLGGPKGEGAILRAAVQRLALVDGYWKLSKSRVSAAAGVPASHFKQHFRDLDDAYLDSVEDLARRLFGPLPRGPEAEDWTGSVCRQVDAVVSRVRGDEPAARLALSGILAPGLSGVTRKKVLIDDLASSWDSSLPSMGRVTAGRTRTAIAGLWAALSRATTTGEPKLLRQAAPTYAYLMLAPAVGTSGASAAVFRRPCHLHRPRESPAVNALVPN